MKWWVRPAAFSVPVLGFVAWFVFSTTKHSREMADIFRNSDREIAALNAKRHAEEEAERRLKRWAFGECQAHGGVPVMGFGPAVTCIHSPLFDSWTVGLDDPPGAERNPDWVAAEIVRDAVGVTHCFDVGKNAPWETVREVPCRR